MRYLGGFGSCFGGVQEVFWRYLGRVKEVVGRYLRSYGRFLEVFERCLGGVQGVGRCVSCFWRCLRCS